MKTKKEKPKSACMLSDLQSILPDKSNQALIIPDVEKLVFFIGIIN